MVLDVGKKLSFLIFASLTLTFACSEVKEKNEEHSFRLINQYVIQKNDNSVDRIYEMQYLKYPGENRKSSSEHSRENELNNKLITEKYYFQVLTSSNINDSLVQEVAKEIIITECSYDIDKESILGKLNFNLPSAQNIKIELRQYSKEYIKSKFDKEREKEFISSLYDGQYLIKYYNSKKNIDNLFLFGIGNYQKDSLMLNNLMLKN